MAITTTVLPSTDVERFIHLGVNSSGGGVSLHWRVWLPVGSLGAMRRALDVAGPYNRFEPDEVADVIGRYADTVMGVELARESSMAVYLHLRTHEHHLSLAQQWAGETRTIADLDAPAVRSVQLRWTAYSIGADLGDIGADEVSYTGWRCDGESVLREMLPPYVTLLADGVPSDHRPTVVRAWWG